jgi:hypothetical protein
MTETIEKKAAATAGAPNSTNTITAADLAKARTEAQAEATEDERERCKGILKASAAAQRDLAVKLVTEGTPLVEALSALNVDLTDRLAQARALPTESTQSLAKGNSAKVAPAETAEDARIKAMPEGDAKWKAEYEASAELQDEFGSFDIYRGWKRNERTLAERNEE